MNDVTLNHCYEKGNTVLQNNRNCDAKSYLRVLGTKGSCDGFLFYQIF